MVVKYDEILCAGEAENFCFESTMLQIVKLCESSNQMDQLKKLIFLTNAMSCVKIPGWEDHQKKFQAEMKAKGIRFMTTDQYIKTLK
jgi:nicotinamidase-related amidase